MHLTNKYCPVRVSPGSPMEEYATLLLKPVTASDEAEFGPNLPNHWVHDAERLGGLTQYP